MPDAAGGGLCLAGSGTVCVVQCLCSRRHGNPNTPGILDPGSPRAQHTVRTADRRQNTTHRKTDQAPRESQARYPTEETTEQAIAGEKTVRDRNAKEGPPLSNMVGRFEVLATSVPQNVFCVASQYVVRHTQTHTVSRPPRRPEHGTRHTTARLPVPSVRGPPVPCTAAIADR